MARLGMFGGQVCKGNNEYGALCAALVEVPMSAFSLRSRTFTGAKPLPMPVAVNLLGGNINCFAS